MPTPNPPQASAHDDLDELRRRVAELEAREAEHLLTIGALRQEQSIYKALLDTIPHLIIRVARDGTLIDFHPSPLFPALLPLDDLRGRQASSLGELFGPWLSTDVIPAGMALLHHTLDSGKVLAFEFQAGQGDDALYYDARLAAYGPDEALVLVSDITAYKRAAQALEESRRRQEQILKTLVDGVVVVDAAGQIVYANQAAALILDMTIDHITSQYFYARGWRAIGADYQPFPPEQLPLAAAMRERQAVREIEHGIIMADDSIRWLSVNAAPLIDQEGQLSGGVASFRDITAHKETEEAHRALVDHSLQGLLVLQDDHVVFANRAAAAIMGYSLEELIGMNVFVLARCLHPDDREWATQLHRDRAAGKPAPPRYEVRMLRPDGSPFWAEIYATRVEYKGRPAIQLAMADIHDRVRAEQESMAAQSMLQQVLDHIPHGVFWKNTNHVFMGCNRAFATFARLADPAQIVGKTDYDLSPPERAEHYQAEDRQVIVSGQPLYDLERRRVQEDKSERWSRTNKIPLRDTAGNILGVLGTVEDITARRQVEQARLAFALEKEKVDILAHFISAASHEFKTPLSIMNTSLYVLQRSAHLQNERDHLEMLKEQAHHLKELVEGMLSMAQLDRETDLPQGPTSLNSLVDNVQVGIGPQITEKGLALQIEIDPELPLVSANARELQHAINNIVYNAIQYTSAPGTITLRTWADTDRVIVAISDTGAGIDPEHLPHIFERFYRVEKARTSRGAGLGLSITHKIMELHHGSIEVDSVPGRGTTFRLCLPLSAPA